MCINTLSESIPKQLQYLLLFTDVYSKRQLFYKITHINENDMNVIILKTCL